MYYLSWGCYYATSASVLGPYLYAGMLLHDASFAPEFKDKDWMMDRHGSVFEWRGQWYFACNDRTHGGTPYFRNTVRECMSCWPCMCRNFTRQMLPKQVIGYLHYRNNGTIAPVKIQSIGSFSLHS